MRTSVGFSSGTRPGIDARGATAANAIKAAMNTAAADSAGTTAIASVSPAATSSSGDGVSPAASASASGLPPGSAAATASADPGRRPGSRSRQRRMIRSTAGSRSRTTDVGVVIVPLSCNCINSCSVLASYARLPVRISKRTSPSA
ncbi:MAG TPA: hypothetical protein VGQ16_05745 [Vicinamibacterales bacterium]|nr:hypothetical protein [Vicinamibacterales bacterium]